MLAKRVDETAQDSKHSKIRENVQGNDERLIVSVYNIHAPSCSDPT